MPKKNVVEEDDGEMNWYKSKGVQKLIENEEPYPLENTDITQGFHEAACENALFLWNL